MGILLAGMCKVICLERTADMLSVGGVKEFKELRWKKRF